MENKLDPKNINIEYPYKVPLKNNKGTIVAYSLVDEDDYDNVMKYKWSLTQGYAHGEINGKKFRLHNFILEKKNKDYVIDHIHRNRCDNRKIYLKEVSKSHNAQNKDSLEGSSSKYIGVVYAKLNKKKWIAQSSYQKKAISLGSFENEIDAAKTYDTFVLLYYGKDAKTNGLVKYEEVKDLNIEIFTNKPKRALPKFIRENKFGSYIIQLVYKGIKYQATLKTLELAQEKLKEFQNIIENIKQKELIEHKNLEIIRNNKGDAIIFIRSKDKTIIDEIVVDDDKWHNLIKYGWYKSNNYFVANVDGANKYIHRFIMNATEDVIVDHRDRNPNNNKVSNLRFSNSILNNHNREKKVNISSKSSNKYIGVTKIVNKRSADTYRAALSKDNKRYYVGTFATDIEAANAYNKKAIELYGEYANLNIIES